MHLLTQQTVTKLPFLLILFRGLCLSSNVLSIALKKMCFFSPLSHSKLIAMDSELQSTSDLFWFDFLATAHSYHIYSWATEDWACDLCLWGEKTVLQEQVAEKCRNDENRKIHILKNVPSGSATVWPQLSCSFPAAFLPAANSGEDPLTRPRGGYSQGTRTHELVPKLNV